MKEWTQTGRLRLALRRDSIRGPLQDCLTAIELLMDILQVRAEHAKLLE